MLSFEGFARHAAMAGFLRADLVSDAGRPFAQVSRSMMPQPRKPDNGGNPAPWGTIANPPFGRAIHHALLCMDSSVPMHKSIRPIACENVFLYLKRAVHPLVSAYSHPFASLLPSSREGVAKRVFAFLTLGSFLSPPAPSRASFSFPHPLRPLASWPKDKIMPTTPKLGICQSRGRSEELQHKTPKSDQRALWNSAAPAQEKPRACVFQKARTQRIGHSATAGWRRWQLRKVGNRPESEGGRVQVFRDNDGQVRRVSGPKMIFDCRQHDQELSHGPGQQHSMENGLCTLCRLRSRPRCQPPVGVREFPILVNAPMWAAERRSCAAICSEDPGIVNFVQTFVPLIEAPEPTASSSIL